MIRADRAAEPEAMDSRRRSRQSREPEGHEAGCGVQNKKARQCLNPDIKSGLHWRSQWFLEAGNEMVAHDFGLNNPQTRCIGSKVNVAR
jgi:hypothetical protein